MLSNLSMGSNTMPAKSPAMNTANPEFINDNTGIVVTVDVEA